MSYKPNREKPPRWATLLLQLFCPANMANELEGDLDELFRQRISSIGLRRARLRYLKDVLSLMRPSLLRGKPSEYPNPNPIDMLQNYMKIAFRNLSKNRTYSAINIAGLSVGMTTAILISLWMWDELSYNKYHRNYDRIARVMQHQTYNGTTSTAVATPLPMRAALQNEHASEFTHIASSSWTEDRILAFGDKKISRKGNCVEPEFPIMMSLRVIKGTVTGLENPTSALLAESVARALFGDDDPINKTIKVDNKNYFKVTGVYEDLPYGTEFRDVKFLLPWSFFLQTEAWVKRSETNWGNNSFLLLVQVAPHTSFDLVSNKIEKIKARHAKEEARFNPRAFLHPMSRWHLYSEWENGVAVRGRIQFVWLFGIIGAFVLLLACINFMNLSTARSQKRAKEVGIRKAVGSLRRQLITQFFSESIMVSVLAFMFALLLLQLILPWFNQIADKQITFPWAHAESWLVGLGFTLATGLLAGSYPAIYLSAFRPVKVLKATGSSLRLHAGRYDAIPRQTLVIVQFTVSITLVIGTLVVLRQIQHAKDRPVGFDRAGLLTVAMNTSDLRAHPQALRQDLLQTGAALNMATSSSPTSEVWSSDASFSWSGKDPDQLGDLGTVGITHEYGKTVGWQVKQGRDFSSNYTTDRLAMVINESAARFMGLKEAVGTPVQWNGDQYKIIGIINDVVTGSPFMPIQPTVFMLKEDWASFIHIRLDPNLNAREALSRLEPVFKKYNPGSPFEYKFASDEYDFKFQAEERIGKLSTTFASLAIFISCLGLFGLATFFAEQRQKEIGLRKVLGASIVQLWQMLAKDFVFLVLISCLIATPIAYYLMHDWLQHYTYRTALSWWIFAVALCGALVITLITVSFQALKAALLNPVKSLKNE
ncbi:ABC transporter permease [Dyadobacter psychrophilus]|uniref:ABC-type antimicrobial peptide transport system, permease component n=1 Tax=Dyadobacter psychrophilus TaxID=651661 RepID=A0A1T5DGI4_9BACT|nr:ABC transporter permease [Dyadobacter psychrophilus]SKB70845.1 ABC-type antimicrobial peptide transport system, permease component [Dyadobacter psychrophilus]